MIVEGGIVVASYTGSAFAFVVRIGLVVHTAYPPVSGRIAEGGREGKEE
jgi:hypothetical protein